MKVPKPSVILNSLIYQPPLPQLTADETEQTLKYAEEGGNTGTSTNLTKLTESFRESHGDHQEPSTKISTAHFKTPMGRCFPGATPNTGSFRFKRQRTPRLVPPTLINLSFSQPNSPRTPRAHASNLRLATPVCTSTILGQRQSQENALNTPCMIGALQELQMAQDTGSLPDLLEWIEDDKTGLSQVERQLLRNTEVELTDQNVVDYLLEVAHEELTTAAGSAGSAEAQIPSPPPQPWQPRYSPPLLKPGPLLETENALNVRRKRRQRRCQKRMTAEEVQVIRKKRATRAARAQQGEREERSRERSQQPLAAVACTDVAVSSLPPVTQRSPVTQHSPVMQSAVTQRSPVMQRSPVTQRSSPVMQCSPVTQHVMQRSPVTQRQSPVMQRSPVIQRSPVMQRSSPVMQRSHVIRRSQRRRRQVSRFEVHW